MTRCGACDKKKGHWPWCPSNGARVHRGGHDPVQAHLAQIEEWAGTVNQRLAALEAPIAEAAAYPDGAPDGIVSPHTRANLEALAAWCLAEVQRLPPGKPGTERILTEMHARIMVALAGGDVCNPPDELP